MACRLRRSLAPPFMVPMHAKNERVLSMNRAGCGSQTGGRDRASVRRSGSWSQCVRKSERRLDQAISGSTIHETVGKIQPEIERRRMKDYQINIFYSEEDGGYIADIPDLNACSAFGQTPDEALKEVQRARKAWLEAARKEGKPIPKARYRPAVYQLAS